jgi:hypothetical protein
VMTAQTAVAINATARVSLGAPVARTHVLLARAATAMYVTSCCDIIQARSLSPIFYAHGHQQCIGMRAAASHLHTLLDSVTVHAPLECASQPAGLLHFASTNNIASPHFHWRASSAPGHLHATIRPSHVLSTLLTTRT